MIKKLIKVNSMREAYFRDGDETYYFEYNHQSDSGWDHKKMSSFITVAKLDENDHEKILGKLRKVPEEEYNNWPSLYNITFSEEAMEEWERYQNIYCSEQAAKQILNHYKDKFIPDGSEPSSIFADSDKMLGIKESKTKNKKVNKHLRVNENLSNQDILSVFIEFEEDENLDTGRRKYPLTPKGFVKWIEDGKSGISPENYQQVLTSPYMDDFFYESTKGTTMKKLTERELNVLEALMAKQAKAKKLGKVLSLQERVVLGKLKAALKRQFESSDDGFGMDFPNEDEMGYEHLIDPEGQTELNGPNGMESNMGMHSGMREKAKALRIKKIKEKILAAKKSRINEEGDFENQYNDKEDANDQMAEEEDMAQDTETIANAFRMVADQLEDEAVSNKDVEGMEGEEMADEDMEDEDFLESVRNRVKNRRVKLAGLRKSVMSEGDKGEAGDTDTGLPDMYLGLAAEIGKNPDTITRQQVEARKARINSIKEKIARAKREAEVKTFGTGKLKTDVEAIAAENVEDFEKKPYAGKKQKTGATKHTGLTEKLNFEDLLKRGLLG